MLVETAPVHEAPNLALRESRASKSISSEVSTNDCCPQPLEVDSIPGSMICEAEAERPYPVGILTSEVMKCELRPLQASKRRRKISCERSPNPEWEEGRDNKRMNHECHRRPGLDTQQRSSYQKSRLSGEV